MEFPSDKKTMRSFLGMVNYLNRYSALSAHICAPPGALRHQVVDYKPGKEHFENFNRLKVEVSYMGLFHTLMSMQKQPSRWMLPRRDLVHALYKRGKLFVMLSEP